MKKQAEAKDVLVVTEDMIADLRVELHFPP